MEAKDLRIGNWVNYKTENIAQEICSIQSDNTIRLKDSKGTNHGCYRMSYVEPIPLTEEWLIKFGFREMEFHLDNSSTKPCYYKNEGYLKINISDEKNLFWFNYNGHLVKIKNAHSLQNLYHVLTNEELTIKK